MMRKRIAIGLLVGAVAGAVDIVPMLLKNLTWDANLSAFAMWLVIGFMVATSELKLHPVPKGIVISYLCLLPVACIIGWKDPASLMPILGMTLVLGAFVGFFFHKLVKK